MSCQSQVIELQQRILDKKSDELDAFTVADTTIVKHSVKSECKGYAEAVKNYCNPVMSPQTLKNLVKQVVKEKERSRNLIVFGLEENEKEIISEKIGDLLETMGERPKTGAYRLGKFSSEKTSPRPVKVTMTSAGNVHYFLEKAKQPKKSSKYSSVSQPRQIPWRA